jgi:hypothetical protein
MKLKKCFVGIAMSTALFAAVATPAFAGNAGDGSGYGTQPGFAMANSHTVCAGHGAFGAFGKDYNLAGGADGQATGANNSNLCGNPQS